MYGTSRSPAKPESGVTVIVPSAASVTVAFGTVIVCGVPGVTGTPLISVIVNGSLSGSVSFASGSITTGESGVAVIVSSLASGPGFTGWMVSVGVITPPSPSSAVNGMAVSPMLSTGGVNVTSLVAGLNVVPAGKVPGAKLANSMVNGSPF